MLIIFLMLATVLKGAITVAVNLVANPNVVMENNSVDLTCFYNDTLSEPTMEWTLSILKQYSIVKNKNGTCKVTGFLARKDLYEVDCFRNKSVSVTIKKVNASHHNLEVRCRILLTFSEVNAVITVQVPVKTAIIITPTGDVLNLKEHENKALSCKTSYCWPIPSIAWFIKEAGELHKINATTITAYTNTSNGLVSAISEMNFTFSRRENGVNLVCSASNLMQQTAVSDKILLNVTYAPDGPPKILGYENENNYSVIESREGRLSCIVVGGNPLPYLKWVCYEHREENAVRENNTVISNITWIAARDHRLCVCESHYMSYIASVRVNVDVLYQPSEPTLKIMSTHVSDRIKVIQNKSLVVTCESTSNPPSRYKWTGPSMFEVSGKTLNVSKVDVQSTGRYVCHVSNTMSGSDGTSQTGNSSKTINVEMLYPAELSYPLMNRSVVEGTRFTIICPVKPGNPNKTSVVWTSGNGAYMSRTATFTIANVTREDVSVYTCTVSNEMKPTYRNVTTHPRRSVFHLNVFFQARVTKFSANSLTSASTFIIKAGDRLSLHCIVEGNPVPQITLSIQDGLPKTMFGRTEMFHEVNNATYMNAGIYSCTGSNNYTLEEPSKKDLLLIVKSFPRPYSENANNRKVFASMHATVTLQFRAHSYLDETGRTTFTWYKKTSPLQTTDYRINITTNGLQSKLSVRNMTRTDFGEYKLHVLNSAGQYVQIYELLTKDIPDMPQNFTFIKRFITESSVTLSWQPGFNGGSQQQFILHYKEISEQDWITIYVNDTGDPVMNFTISELESYTDYHIKLSALNVEGNSNETQTLKFRTNDDSRETNSNIAGALAGSTIGGTAIIAGSLVGVWFLRKRYMKKKNRCNERTKIARSNNAASEMKTIAETAYEKIKRDTDRRDVDGVENAYEQLKPGAERETSERKEKEYEELKADEDCFDSTIPVYINLTL